MGRPTIGITTRTIMEANRALDGASVEYAEAIARAGGVPVQLPGRLRPVHREVLGAVDALVLTGGGDVDPRLYGERPSSAVGGVDPARDEWELELTKQAVDESIPLLAICRGCQILNVARGGTLIQDLPTVTSSNHLVLGSRDVISHQVQIQPGSRLAEIVGSDDLEVNSIHHQAVDAPGLAVEVGARSTDGVIESIELEGPPALGVQWHPEDLQGRPRHELLFEWLVEEANELALRRAAGEGSLSGAGGRQHG